MKPAASRFHSCLIAILAVALVGLSLLWLGREKTVRHELSDGRWIEIRHVTAATNGNHTIPFGARWRRDLRKFPLPRRIKGWVANGTGSGSLGGDPLSLGVWWTAGGTGTNASGFQAGQVPAEFRNAVWRIVGDNGWIYPAEFRGAPAGLDNVAIHSLTLGAFPRRQSRLRAEMCDQTNGRVIASFLIDNPYPVATDTWTPAALPASHRIGSLTVRLDGIDSATLDPKQALPVFGLTRRFSPRYSLVSDGSATSGWDPMSAELFDAAGNRGPYLDPSENAWKVRITVLPKALTRGPNDAVAAWSSPALRVPQPGTWLPLSETLTLAGRPYPVLGLGGAGRHLFTNDIHSTSMTMTGGDRSASASRIGTQSTTTINHPQAVLCGLGWPETPAGSRLLLRVRLANGQETAVNEFHEAGRIRYFPLPADLTAGFTFELVLQKSETVEFLVAPPKAP
jgi:hypothetical protein